MWLQATRSLCTGGSCWILISFELHLTTIKHQDRMRVEMSNKIVEGFTRVLVTLFSQLTFAMFKIRTILKCLQFVEILLKKDGHHLVMIFAWTKDNVLLQETFCSHFHPPLLSYLLILSFSSFSTVTFFKQFSFKLGRLNRQTEGPL